MFYLGLDLGQRRDWSAVAVVEKGRCLVLRDVKRVPLGTPYPEVVEKVRAMTWHPVLRGRCTLAVDSTGLGTPVVEMLRAAGLGCEVNAVTITPGEKETQHGLNWNVPKRDLISGLQVLLDNGRLKIAAGLKEMEVLMRELTDMRMTIKSGGRVRMGADRSGQHDDLVIALALACWRAEKLQRMNSFGTQRLPGI